MYSICIVQRFEPQGRRFINFLYYYYLLLTGDNGSLYNGILQKCAYARPCNFFFFFNHTLRWLSMEIKNPGIYG